ncbi:alpha/beta fold hydrolase [Sinorhizobium meliloti]|uniref:alpha/beta fold hydrolase n=1 Tax=Rhizobium meliloti TaxID=382 RepID=UPI000FD50B33|nr:alpha/beta fold hydrolase [Sinorhizobium meliloti]MQV24772.1 alpha/beta fold hydrolase [Sinorhizobium meliloti]MQV35019.1 alpha/beta fold hydrolase [Sinorhizobium meliloti]RVE76918.1 alpha/beta fold hydrolase [Sinorhizobium meliloti]RVG43857.1 alpha/beta fold hydrolase [Sinorhizobium meliloti]RVM02350.1 alpha/beta fold hydrolase [Sinorhizobium meliloti]
MLERQEWPGTGIEGFERGFATVDGVRLHYVSGGRADGEVLLLFAGFPQSWYAWRKIMPVLGTRYRIIAPDLPGQGDSDRPMGGFDTMSIAKIARGLVERLGVDRHFLVAHDIGAWVAYPYAALYGSSVKGLAILDTGIPGISLPDALPWSSDVAWRTWHVAFHNVADLPETLIEGREHIYLNWFLQRKAANPQVFSDADFEEYLRVFLYSGLKGGLAYYRAVTLSAQQNRELSAKGKLEMPVLAVRADQGSMPDLVAQLQKIATNVRGTAIESCGHYLAEEQPDALARELQGFFG